ncbi:hypothetical protein DFP72DRAFT_966778 [Ephemerocybe angulata]|uniref:Uncharacterized protein n=1 Tax=Ephemerocybe angulata TaxID=980116 RepID=A0A8H6M3S0_9AGAR|nr:hypothetical protein DFP72DRAFT_966778 [Tulosesus angulatus]
MSESASSTTVKPTVPTNEETGDASNYRALDMLAYHVLDKQYAPVDLFPPHMLSKNLAPTVLSSPTWFTISSPNVKWIPRFNPGPQRVRARRDGRFGPHDRTLTPQVCCGDYSFMACIPCNADPILYWTPTRADAPAVRGNAFVYHIRILKGDKMRKLEAAFETCRARAQATATAHPKATLLSLLTTHGKQCMDCLTLYGGNFKDLLENVADLQRTCLDILGVCNFLDKFYPRYLAFDSKIWPVDESIIGGFTVSTRWAQACHQMGIPVWLIRPNFTIIPDVVKIYRDGQTEMTTKRDIVEDDYEEEPGNVQPYPCIYEGLPCSAMYSAMQRLGFRILDETASSEDGWNRLTGRHPAQQTKYVMALPPDSIVPPRDDQIPQASSTNAFVTPSSSFTPSQSPLLRHLSSGPAPPGNLEDETPPKVPIWVCAMSAIDRKIKPAIDKTSPYWGFPLPPSTLFTTPNSRKGRAIYMATWLGTRLAHMSNILRGVETGPLSIQNWRTFLHKTSKLIDPDLGVEDDDGGGNGANDNTNPEAPQSAPQGPKGLPARPTGPGVVAASTPSTSKRKAPPTASGSSQQTPPRKKPKTKARKNPVPKYFVDVLRSKEESLDRIDWIETSVLLGKYEDLEAALTPRVTSEMLYELEENSFRMDLLSLDRVRAPSKWPAELASVARFDQLLILDRCKAVQAVFPMKLGQVLDNLVISFIPNVDRGLASYDHYGRHTSLVNLRALMLDWEGCPEDVRRASVKMIQSHVNQLEIAVVTFYCQAFWNSFGRLPVPPPRLPQVSRSRSEPKSLAADSLGT